MNIITIFPSDGAKDWGCRFFKSLKDPSKDIVASLPYKMFQKYPNYLDEEDWSVCKEPIVEYLRVNMTVSHGDCRHYPERKYPFFDWDAVLEILSNE